MFDYTAYLHDRILPGLMDTRFTKPLEQLYSFGTVDKSNPGGLITKRIQAGYTDAARNFTRTDIDPTTTGVPQYVDAYWTPIYQEVPVEISRIDLNKAKGSGMQAVENLLNKEVSDALDDLMNKVYTNSYAQIKLDLTTSGTYSDAALSRSTYSSLATGYYEATDTAITTAYLRACQDTVGTDQNDCDPRMFNFFMGPAVFSKAKVAIATQTGVVWNSENTGGKENGGYGAIANFEGTPINLLQGMTVGDVFYVRKEDLIFHEHMALDVSYPDPGKFAIKVIFRIGVNAYVLNPGKQGLMVSKD